MKKRTKKILALLLAIVMAISLMPLAALAEEMEQGEVAAVVYGPDFTNIIAEGNGTVANMVDVLKRAISGEEFIPEATITLTSEADPSKTVKMEKTSELKFNESLQFESNKIQELEAAIPDLEKKVDEAQAYYDSIPTTWSNATKKAKALAALGEAIFELKTAEGLVMIASNGKDYFLDNVNIAESGRGIVFDTYTSGKIDAGWYKLHIDQFEGEGYALTDYSLRDQRVYVSENGGKPVFVGSERDWSGIFGYGDLSIDYSLKFPGFWMKKVDIGFEFTSADVVGNGVNGATFAMVNRDQVQKVLAFMKDVGESTFDTVMANLQNEEVFDYKEVLELHKNLIDTSNPSVPIDLEVAQKLVNSYMALFTGIDKEFLADFEAARADGMVLPAILVATSENVDGKDGVVRFSENSNQTLTWMMDALEKIFANVTNMSDTLKPIFDLYTSIKGLAEGLINSVGYDLAQFAGIVSKKMPTGYYWMFQSEAAEKYQRSPLVYTMKVKWDNPTWLYVTVADLGIVGPYALKDFYDYVRDTTFEGPVAKAFKVLSRGYEFGSDATLYNIEITENLQKALMTGSLDLGDEDNQALQGAYTAYIANATYNALGLDKVFKTRVALLNGINDYLIDNQKTADNLMNYVNEQARKSKSVFTDNVSEDWVFYNLDTSPTMTATKLINKSTEDIAAAMPNGSAKQLSVKENGKTVSKIVETVGNKIEDTNRVIAKKVKDVATTLFGKLIDNVKTGVENVAKNLFSNIFSNLFGGSSNQTAGA